MPSYKDAAVVLPERCALGDRKNMVFSGTLVAAGRGKAVVVRTGSGTELGRIATLTQSIKEKPTPLQVRISELTKLIAVTVIILTAVTVAVGLLRGQSLVDSALIGLSLLVVTIPEDLPILTFVILVTSVIQMAKKRALIRKLYSAETLGSTTTICSDKTGTITENKMQVSTIYANGVSFDSSVADARVPQETLTLLAKVATFCNDSVPQSDAKLPAVGNPVDVALISLVEKIGFEPRSIRETGQLLHEEPFDNTRKMMLSAHRMEAESLFVSAKGAPEVIIRRCSSLYGPTRELPMADEDRRELLRVVLTMSNNGLRVLALAYKALPSQPLSSPDTYYSDLVFIGLVGLEDPPRREVKAAIAECKKAGIRTIMVTGDHAMTALSVAKAVELAQNNQVITGEELDGMNDDQLSSKLVDVSVFARVTPEHKLRIVKALKAQGEVVAVTGDGVNDAPALREADIGAAMGSGTDVAKEAASMILADDNFTTIVTAVREGRRLFDNLRKAIRYYLPSKIGILMTVFFSLLLGAGTPLTPLQIILMEVVNDIQASTTFATEPSEPDIMHRPPRSTTERIITRSLSLQIFSRASAIFLGALAVFLLYLNGGSVLEKARTMVFVNIMLSLTLLALFSRSEKSPLHRLGVRSNNYMLYVLLLSVLTVYLVTVLEPLQLVFNTTALNPWDWLAAVSVSVLATGWIEVGKIISSYRVKSSESSGSRTLELIGF
jgi:Ca2+-transporting ATPase